MNQLNLFPDPAPARHPDAPATVAKAATVATAPQQGEPSPDTQLGQLWAAVRGFIGTGPGRVTPHVLADRLGWDVDMVRSRAATLQRVYPGLVVVEADWVKGVGR